MRQPGRLCRTKSWFTESARVTRLRWARFTNRYAALLFSTSLRILGSRSEAEDLLHDVLLEAWQSAKQYDPARGSVRTWLLVRLRSRALDRLGRAAPFDRQANEPVAAANAPGTLQANDRLAIVQALERLDPDVRTVLELVYFRGLTGREISERMGVPLGTVKSRLARGLEALEALLEPEES